MSDESKPLHDHIDEQISANHFGPLADVASDEDFARRIYLDLIGRIPAAEEARTFFDDSSADKRKRLVEKLLASDEFNRAFAKTLDVTFMERRASKDITNDEWETYLYKSLANNKPFNKLVEEILSADGANPATRPAAKFFVDRGVEPHAMTQTVSRMFFGRNIECAQCHDHPIIDDYLQSEYFGLFAFLSRSSLFQDDKQKSFIAEKAEGQVEFVSVFEPGEGKTRAIPRLVDGAALEIESPAMFDDGYLVKAAPNVASIPKFSRRQQMASLVATSSRAFQRNAVNRLWAHMMGVGIVEPVDLHHSSNPPSHAQLLSILADEFANHDFDIKALLKQIALSDAYQRKIELPRNDAQNKIDFETIATELNRRLSEQQSKCELLAVDVAKTEASLAQKRAELGKLDGELEALAKSLVDTQTVVTKETAAKAGVEKLASPKRSLLQSIEASAAAAKNAAELAKGNQALKQAAEIYTKQLDATKSEITNFEKKAAEHQQSIDSAQQKIQNAKSSIVQFNAKRSLQADLVAEDRGAFRFVSAKHERASLVVSDLERQIQLVHAEIQLMEKRKSQTEAVVLLQPLKDSLNEATQQLNLTQNKRVAAQADFDKKQSSVDAAQQQLAQAKQELERPRNQIESLDEAAEKAESVAKQLLDDAQLLKIASDLRERSKKIADSISVSMRDLDTVKLQVDDELAQLEAKRAELTAATKAESEAKSTESQLQRHVDEALAKLKQAEVDVELARQQILKRWARRFVARNLKPLSPEQLGRSVVKAFAIDQQFQTEAVNEWTEKNKEKKPEEIDPHQKAVEIEKLYRKRVKQVESTFVGLFAAPPGSPQDVFSSTADQALFLGNDGRVRGWLAPREGSLLHRLNSELDVSKVAQDLYLSLLSRNPDAKEVAVVRDYLAPREKDRNAALQELAWGLMTSLEFRFSR